MIKGSIIKKLHKDNKGAGLLMVLIMVAFLGILAGILMFVTYMGYQMRLVDKQGKDNFYTAETVLDEINVGLQAELSVALTDAYGDVMRNYSIYNTPEERAARFNEKYVALLKMSIEDPAHSGHYDIDKLRSYVSESLLGDGAEGVTADGSSDNFGSYGAIIESAKGEDLYPLINDGKGLVISDLKVSYVNEQGFVSIITTDLRLTLPEVRFADNTATPDLNRYCIIADGGLRAGNRITGGSIEITGDVYADTMILGKQSGTDYNGDEFIFAENTKVIFEAPDEADSEAMEKPVSTIVSNGNIEINNSGLITTQVDLWGRNIVLNSASVNLTGNTYMENDMKLEGTGSEAVLSGTYTGFGVGTDIADSSSAIVINGRDSSLDFSSLKTIIIGGHTFVGTSSQELMNGVNDGDERTDILMGESVAVKSNQLIYLIPPEALGCERLEDGVIGESAYRSNPMRIEQYMEIKNNPEQYLMLDANRQIEALGYNRLSDYMEKQELADGTLDYRPTIIVKQTNSGSLVYCYMKFKDREAANRYFRDYYGENAENVEKYTRIYAEAIKMPEESEDLLYLHLAGNVLTYEAGGDYEVFEATDDYGETNEASKLASVRVDMYKALISKMDTNLSRLTLEEQSKTVYENIVAENGIRRIVNGLRSSGTEDTVIVESADGLQSAVFSTGDYTIDLSTPANVALVVCEGDIRVKKDFKGSLIAGGEIIISDDNDNDRNVELTTLKPEEFNRLMMANATAGDGTGYYVYEVFKDGTGYVSNIGLTVDKGTEDIDISELIVYERWSKR